MTPPYYAVIFTSIKKENAEGYASMAERMVELAQQQPGFLGVESARQEIGITVSYWKSLEAIKQWNHIAANAPLHKNQQLIIWKNTQKA